MVWSGLCSAGGRIKQPNVGRPPLFSGLVLLPLLLLPRLLLVVAGQWWWIRFGIAKTDKWKRFSVLVAADLCVKFSVFVGPQK